MLAASLLADVAEVAVPEDRQTVDKKYTVVDWDEGEVHDLNKRPNHPVALQRRRVGSCQLLTWADTLEDGHGAQEDEKVGWRENKLVDGHTCTDLELLVLRNSDLGLEELEPCCRSWSKDCF